MDGLENALIDEVNSRMNFYEYKYNVKILFWALRSSVNLGIVRRNSDLDIMFAYKNLNPFVCSGIHDILGHGLDLWGIDIEDIIKTISVNNQILYEAKDSTYSLWTISQQHVRGGCNYYFGIYSVLGTEYMYPTTSFIADTSEYFMMMFEKKIVIKQMLILIGKVVNEIKIYEQVSLYDYIYTMWRILLCHNLIDGGILHIVYI